MRGPASKAGPFYGQDVRDAENAGPDDVASFSREVMEQDSRRARRCHDLLRQPAGTVAGGPATAAPTRPGSGHRLP